MNYSAVLVAGALVFAAGLGSGVVLSPSSPELGPDQMVVDKSEALDGKNSLTDTKQGPTGTLAFEECEGEDCTIDVEIDEFHQYHMFLVVLSDANTTERWYLTPENPGLRLEGVKRNSSLRIAVPVEESIGYAWSESYSIRWQIENNQSSSEHEIDAMVYRTIVNEEYFFTDLPSAGEEGGGDRS